MATFDYNPITGNLDLVGSGASYINGVVADPTALPVTVGTPPLDSVYLAKAGSGVWLINRRPAGLYCRTANNGVAADWTYLGAFPEVNADGNWELYNSADPTKELKFDLSGLPTATIRTVTAPAGNGQMLVEGQSIGATTRNTGAFTTLNATNGTITASAPVLDLSQTWNNAAVTFTGLRFNVTNTASAAASLIADFQVGGTSIVSIGRDGFIGSANAGINVRATGSLNRLSFFSQGATRLLHNNSILLNEGDGGYGWVTSGAPSSLSFDTGIFRGAAGTIDQRNGTNPQTFRLYNTYTDASNYERAKIAWSSNVLQIGTEKAGTGSARALEFQTDGTSRWQITTAGILTTVSAPADSGGLTLQGGWLVYRAGSTNHWAIVSGDITQRATGNFQWSGQSDAANFSGDWLRLSRPAGGCLLLSAGTSTEHRLQFGGTSSSFPALKRSSTTLQVRLADDSAFAPLSCGALTLNGNLDASTKDIVTDTTTGTKIGTGTTQKLGFFNATPIVRPAAIADATDAATTQARLNDLLAAMRSLGLIAT